MFCLRNELVLRRGKLGANAVRTVPYDRPDEVCRYIGEGVQYIAQKGLAQDPLEDFGGRECMRVPLPAARIRYPMRGIMGGTPHGTAQEPARSADVALSRDMVKVFFDPWLYLIGKKWSGKIKTLGEFAAHVA